VFSLARFISTFSSVQFSCSVVSDSLRPHESQHARPPCPSPTPGVHSDSRPSSQWCHLAISSSVVPLRLVFPWSPKQLVSWDFPSLSSQEFPLVCFVFCFHTRGFYPMRRKSGLIMRTKNLIEILFAWVYKSSDKVEVFDRGKSVCHYLYIVFSLSWLVSPTNHGSVLMFWGEGSAIEVVPASHHCSQKVCLILVLFQKRVGRR